MIDRFSGLEIRDCLWADDVTHQYCVMVRDKHTRSLITDGDRVRLKECRGWIRIMKRE